MNLMRMMAAVLAMLLASAALWLERRSRPSPSPREECPRCAETLTLPAGVCPSCGADLAAGTYGGAGAMMLSARRRQIWFRWSEVLVLFAVLVLLAIIPVHLPASVHR